MLFNCSPAELIDHILFTVSFSGQSGIALPDLWREISNKLNNESTDLFQKKIIWRWLFHGADDTKLIFKKNDVLITIKDNYQAAIDESDEEAYIVYPSEITQCKYLTGNNLTFKRELGEFPFQLLCVIAKYGATGITTPALCKEAGQDPRSSTNRLNKLEELGLIYRKQFYDTEAKLHTNLSIHKKFASDEIKVADTDLEDSYESSRHIAKLRQYIVNAVKIAPNGIRAFRDLKMELNLDKDISSNKLFNSVVWTLASAGYIENVKVQSPDYNSLIRCLKFLKDLPKNYSELPESMHLVENDIDDFDDEPVSETSLKYPCLNKLFPITGQVFNLISSKEFTGITILELTLKLTGSKLYRPYRKLLENFTSYNSDGKQLKYLRKYPDPFRKFSVVRQSDFHGRHKFYRYFARDFVKADDAKLLTDKASKEPSVIPSLAQLQKRRINVKDKFERTPLFNWKKRSSTTETTPRVLKRLKSNESAGKTRKQSQLNFESTNPLISSRMKLPTVADPDTPARHVSAANLPGPRVIIKPTSRARQSIAETEKGPSLKALKRREALINILLREGGILVATARLCRELDRELGSKQKTDNKTLARDMKDLVKAEKIVTQPFMVTKGTTQVKKRVVILKSLQPPEEKINEIIENYTNSEYKIVQTTFRTLESDVKIYQQNSLNLKPRLKSLASDDSAPRRRRRKTTIEVKTEDNEELVTTPDRRSRKKQIKSEDLFSKSTRKKRARTKKKDKYKNNYTPGQVSIRSSFKFHNNDATKLYRIIVIHKTFFKTQIDFDQLGEFFDGMNGRSLERKWAIIRKLIGGLPAVQKGCDSFERMVLRAIEDDLLSPEDIRKRDIQFFLDLWKDNDNSELESVDKPPLYATVQHNREVYEFTESHPYHIDLYDQLEDNSMRQKESILSSTIFFYNKSEQLQEEKNSDLRTVIKAIFSTEEKDFSNSLVRSLLSRYPEPEIEETVSQLVADKELTFYSLELEDSEKRFSLTEKFSNSFVYKNINSKFYNEAESLNQNLISMAEASKGLIVSHGIRGSEMAVMLQLSSRLLLSLIRIEIPYKFSGYESRLIDKEKLSCDIVAVRDHLMAEGVDQLEKVPLPMGTACSRIWIDINGSINSDCWVKIIITVVYYILSRPGINDRVLHGKLQIVLSIKDFEAVIDWLIATKCITKTDDAYYVSDNWYSILGP